MVLSDEPKQLSGPIQYIDNNILQHTQYVDDNILHYTKYIYNNNYFYNKGLVDSGQITFILSIFLFYQYKNEKIDNFDLFEI